MMILQEHALAACFRHTYRYFHVRIMLIISIKERKTAKSWVRVFPAIGLRSPIDTGTPFHELWVPCYT